MQELLIYYYIELPDKLERKRHRAQEVFCENAGDKYLFFNLLTQKLTEMNEVTQHSWQRYKRSILVICVIYGNF